MYSSCSISNHGTLFIQSKKWVDFISKLDRLPPRPKLSLSFSNPCACRGEIEKGEPLNYFLDPSAYGFENVSLFELLEPAQGSRDCERVTGCHGYGLQPLAGALLYCIVHKFVPSLSCAFVVQKKDCKIAAQLGSKRSPSPVAANGSKRKCDIRNIYLAEISSWKS